MGHDVLFVTVDPVTFTVECCCSCVERRHPESAPCDRYRIVQVPSHIFITDKLPKTATGKIQRRKMVDHFMKGPSSEQPPAGGQKQIRSKL